MLVVREEQMLMQVIAKITDSTKGDKPCPISMITETATHRDTMVSTGHVHVGFIIGSIDSHDPSH